MSAPDERQTTATWMQRALLAESRLRWLLDNGYVPDLRRWADNSWTLDDGFRADSDVACIDRAREYEAHEVTEPCPACGEDVCPCACSVAAHEATLEDVGVPFDAERDRDHA